MQVAGWRQDFDFAAICLQRKVLLDSRERDNHAAIAAKFRHGAFHVLKDAATDSHPGSQDYRGMRSKDQSGRQRFSDSVNFSAFDSISALAAQKP
jgi:hypothetical protein